MCVVVAVVVFKFLKKSGVWFMKKYPSYLTGFEKFNSTSNISQMERDHQSNMKQSNASPMCLKRNLSSSSTNSSAFSFWKSKIFYFKCLHLSV